MNKEQKKPMYRRKEETKNIVQFDNNVSETRRLWRCIACGVGVSFGSVESFDRWLDAHKLGKSESKVKDEKLLME